MPDITMCTGGECPLKNKCYRYTASPDERQSYFVEIPGRWDWRKETIGDKVFDHRDFVCDMFWGEKQEEIMEQLNKIVGNENSEI